MNILVVDDQINVVNGIVHGISWDALGINEVYKAQNMEEAKFLFKNLKIDILLTDIEMPGGSGIDLVKWVRLQRKETECIFLTSHADFDYAKDAVKLGSFDYILQPCPYSDIEEVIQKAVNKILLKTKQKQYSDYGEKIRFDYSIQNTLFSHCLQEADQYKSLENYISDTGEQEEGFLILFLFENICIKNWDKDLLGFILQNIISEQLDEYKQKILLCHTEECIFAAFIYGAATGGDAIIEYYIQILEKILKENLKFDIQFSFLNRRITVHELYSSYQNLKKFDKGNKKTEGNTTSLNDKNDLVRFVKNYIEGHIGEHFTRDDLAKLVHINMDYLARIFKAETGYTINNYIILSKMQVAQKLLQTTVLPIGLIAAKVGYDNFSYFSKLYKKVMGISPTDERKQ